MLKSGPNLGLPYTKAMRKGLFEIRAKGHAGIARGFFCMIYCAALPLQANWANQNNGHVYFLSIAGRIFFIPF